MTSSVLIPSFKRGEKLRTCLRSLARQAIMPNEIIVVWQGDDTATRDLAESCRGEIPGTFKVIHLPVPGIVPAENAALGASTGEIIFLIDDDAIAPPDWIAKHLAHYQNNSRAGAVGGSAVNFQDGVPFPQRSAEPVGTITFYGQLVGNMYDHIDEWRIRPPRKVQHLVGYNMSLRRAAFDRFEERLRSYWQMFEADACLQVTRNGYEVWFDFSNVVEHHPSNQTFSPGRQGNLESKVINPAYNHAFVLAKFTPWYQWPTQWLFLLLVGSTNMPGIAGFLNAVRRYGNPRLEVKILLRTFASRLAGWCAGLRARASQSPVRSPLPTSTEAKP